MHIAYYIYIGICVLILQTLGAYIYIYIFFMFFYPQTPISWTEGVLEKSRVYSCCAHMRDAYVVSALEISLWRSHFSRRRRCFTERFAKPLTYYDNNIICRRDVVGVQASRAAGLNTTTRSEFISLRYWLFANRIPIIYYYIRYNRHPSLVYVRQVGTGTLFKYHNIGIKNLPYEFTTFC